MARGIEVRSHGLMQASWNNYPEVLNDGSLVLLGTTILTLATDFGLFLAHWLQHRIPALWRFHAVHHSAESLTPFTAYRQHPIDYIGNSICIGLMTGLAFTLIHLLTGQPAKMLHIEGSTIPFLIFYWLGYHLRHSDVWIDYGARWSRIFISPAQHQIHHSLDVCHRDKNMGYMFAFWDQLFGTLYIPKTREKIDYGLQGSGLSGGFFSLLWLPVYQTLKFITPASRVMYVLILISSAVLFTSQDPHPPTPIDPFHSVWLEQMTSQEVSSAINNGFDRVIIPTGGTEQNGSHLALGKHNAIVGHNAENLALRLGYTLIAPVMAYVPEGQISPPEGHMRYAGTISLQESTFEAILEDTAKSLKVHGFQRIFLLGDSGGNQIAQDRVAERLNHEWEHESARVISLSDYYRLGPQIRYLQNQGFSSTAIGSHAGIRDTSELEFIAPELIRTNQFEKRNEDVPDGSDGNPKLASPVIGEFLTQLKVQAAYIQATRSLTSKVRN